MPNFTEHFVGQYLSTKLDRRLHTYATKADTWCFVRFELEVQDRHETVKDLLKNAVFFFECSLQLSTGAFFREMNKECPYPPIRPIEAPVEEICYR
jgi:hypothetical protein